VEYEINHPYTWLKQHPNGSILLLYIQPGASKTMVSGEFNQRLKIKVKAPPRDGEANEAVIEFLAEVLKISKSRVHLIHGESSRQKNFLIELPPTEIITFLKLLQ
jgi:uncharacterized protein (TIGR00251 family)